MPAAIFKVYICSCSGDASARMRQGTNRQTFATIIRYAYDRLECEGCRAEKSCRHVSSTHTLKDEGHKTRVSISLYHNISRFISY